MEVKTVLFKKKMRTARIKEGFGMIQRDIMVSEISIHSKALYALLVSYAGEKQTCYPSINTICKNLKVSKPTILKSILELKKNNLVIVQKKLNKNGDYGNNIYEPLYLIEEVGVVKEVDYPSQLDLLGVVKEVDPKNNNIRNNIKESFGLFWDLYGYKIGKDAAEKSWKKLTEEERIDCMQKTPNWLEELKKETWRSQPHASTFLNGKRWLDEVVADKQEEHYEEPVYQNVYDQYNPH